MKEITIGAKAAVQVPVTDDKTARYVGSGSLLVFATPMMAANMEKAACKALEPFLEDGETTVGTELNIQHTAATPVGLAVTAEAEVTAVNGREIAFKVTARDTVGEIGSGTHKRFLVFAEKFQDKADKRGADLPLEIERKYLIRRPAEALLRSLPEADVTEILQTYLKFDETGMMRRVRKRGSDAKGWQYTYTRKTTIGFGKRVELEEEITEAQYQTLLEEANPSMQPVHKARWCFVYQDQLFELDVYAFSETLATLEIELPDIDKKVELPPEIDVLADVTGDKRYSNYALSKAQAFPETEQ